LVEEHEKRVPGISFWLTSHNEMSTDRGIVQIIATLHGEYGKNGEDAELWKKVYTKMADGFRIFSENDFQAEVLQVLREEYEQECKKHEGTRRVLALQTAELERVQRKLAGFEATLGQLGAGLRSK
jgi:hypothetical protein